MARRRKPEASTRLWSVSTCNGSNFMLLGCQGSPPCSEIPWSPWEMSSASPRRNTKSSTSSKIPVIPQLPLLDQDPVDTCKAFLFALLQTPPGNPPSMTARQVVHCCNCNLARCFHLCLNPSVFVTSYVKQCTLFSSLFSSVFVQLQYWLLW